MAGDPCTARILLDIFERHPEVPFGKRAGKVTLLPEVPAAVPAHIHILRVAAVHTAKEHGERIGSFGDHDEVDVVRHEAIGQHANGAILQLFAE
ncbi:MAG: hypothetical protein ABL995_11900 [Bryobacteraceae bacterium]